MFTASTVGTEEERISHRGLEKFIRIETEKTAERELAAERKLKEADAA